MDLSAILAEIDSIKFKNDDYRKKRGKPVMLIITCAKCQAYLMSYQKDGPGPLIRCYMDRIHHPEALQKRQYLPFEKRTFPSLECSKCHTVIGSPIIYAKESRPAYHLRPGFFEIIHKGRSKI